MPFDAAPLDLTTLRQGYADGSISPESVLEQVVLGVERTRQHNAWIHALPHHELLVQLERARRRGGPLLGVPFAVKDNIDVAGLPTTAACPSFSYTPSRSAGVVQRLMDAGAILVGKTNLDQFATGLVGVRSPYGACSNWFDRRYIAGGSSAGSALAVAGGAASFSLGTDTAGSGRVPAAFHGLIGLKPTRGLISTSGVVPACRSLDCVSIFATSAEDAADVFSVCAAVDAEDPYSRRAPVAAPLAFVKPVRFGIPARQELEFFGDEMAESSFAAAVAALAAIGGEVIEIDFSPFREVAGLLYAGPWVAERYAAVGQFLEQEDRDVDPIVARIILQARHIQAAEAFKGIYRLEGLKRRAERVWERMDVLVVPTAGTIYSIDQVLADPVSLNTNLGYYTNFVNLMDLAAIAVPAGRRPDGLPFGITLVGPRFSDHALLDLARCYMNPQTFEVAQPRPRTGETCLAVAGAHLNGQPLNGELTTLGARLLCTTRTAGDYQLYALANSAPPKPGLRRLAGHSGTGIEVEVWCLSSAALGDFMTKVKSPLAIGTIELCDGTIVHGFVCEAHGLVDAIDITEFGSWRNYLNSVRS